MGIQYYEKVVETIEFSSIIEIKMKSLIVVPT
jgi:hypothetical protein